jgi:hypothetical protein
VRRFTSVSLLLEELSPELPALSPSWDDVLARAQLLADSAAANGDGGTKGGRSLAFALSPSAKRPPRRRFLLTAAAIMALVFAVVAAAYALGHPIIDFGKAPKGPRQVVNDFGRLTVGATPIYVLPHQARRITSVRIDGKERVLWVAPMRQGGFCYQWSGPIGFLRSGLIGSCHPADQRGFLPSGLEWSGILGPRGVTILGGSFTSAAAARIVIAYADGRKSEIPFVWINAPINAGFFLYRIPDAHRRRGHLSVAITLLDSSNRVIYRERTFAGRPPLRVAADLVRRRITGYGSMMVPAQAKFSDRRQLFAWRAPDGAQIGLWIAPERGGGTCFWTDRASGCSVSTASTLALTLKRRLRHVDLCCLVATNVARVVAHFQDGEQIDLAAKDGYLLWPIPARHYPPGHRLDELDAYDASGSLIESHPVVTNVRALYPCSKPKNYGYGLTMCP